MRRDTTIQWAIAVQTEFNPIGIAPTQTMTYWATITAAIFGMTQRIAPRSSNGYRHRGSPQKNALDQWLPFLPAKSRANWCTLFLLIHGIITIASMASTMAEIGMLQRIEAGECSYPFAETASNDGRQATIGFLYLLTFVAAGIAWCPYALCTERAKTWAPGMAAKGSSPGWAVRWWFILVMLAIHAVSSNEAKSGRLSLSHCIHYLETSGAPVGPDATDLHCLALVGPSTMYGSCAFASVHSVWLRQLFRCPDDKRRAFAQADAAVGIRLSCAGFS